MVDKVESSLCASQCANHVCFTMHFVNGTKHVGALGVFWLRSQLILGQILVESKNATGVAISEDAFRSVCCHFYFVFWTWAVVRWGVFGLCLKNTITPCGIRHMAPGSATPLKEFASL